MKIGYQQVKRFFIINAGLFIMALGLVIFLEPAKLAVGGVMGLSMVIRAYIPSIDLGLLMLIFNVFLFILAFFMIGKSFGGYTIYCSVALSFMTSVLTRIYGSTNLFPDDLMVTLFIGILVQGVGMAMVFSQNASTGGTDIVAKILNKYTHIEIGKSLFLSDALITVAAGIAFETRLGMYAFLGILMNGLIIDKVIAGFETKAHCQIISHKSDEIVSFIHNDLGRGCTYLKAVGAYSMKDTNLISVVLGRREYIKLKSFVRSVDPRAFITMHFTHEVLGEGFDLEVIENMTSNEVEKA